MYDCGLLHEQTCIPRHPSGSESRAAIGIGEGIVDGGRGATEKTITHCMELVYMQSLLQELLSGSVSGVAIGIGGGIADEVVGARGRRIN